MEYYSAHTKKLSSHEETWKKLKSILPNEEVNLRKQQMYETYTETYA